MGLNYFFKMCVFMSKLVHMLPHNSPLCPLIYIFVSKVFLLSVKKPLFGDFNILFSESETTWESYEMIFKFLMTLIFSSNCISDKWALKMSLCFFPIFHVWKITKAFYQKWFSYSLIKGQLDKTELNCT